MEDESIKIIPTDEMKLFILEEYNTEMLKSSSNDFSSNEYLQK